MARPSEHSAFVEPLGALLFGVLLAAAARRYVASARPRPRCLPPDFGVRVALLPGLRTLRPVQEPLAQDVLGEGLARRVEALRARLNQLLLDRVRHRLDGGIPGAQGLEIGLVGAIDHVADHLIDLRLALARRAVRVEFRDLPDIAGEEGLLLFLALPPLLVGYRGLVGLPRWRRIDPLA